MNIPTIEELEYLGCQASGMTKVLLNHRRQKYLTAIRDAVVAACRPQLRPIAEMPNKVPEGCVRMFWGKGNLDWYSSPMRLHTATHYIDIALPSPTYPAEFEAAFAESKLDAKDKDAAFKLWKGGAR